MIVMTLESIRPWKTTLECLQKLTKEVGFYANQNGLHVKTCDDTQAAMFDIVFPRECFSSYHCDEAINFGIYLPNCLEIARRITTNADIEIRIDTSKNKFILNYRHNGMTRSFKTHLISTEIADLPVPDEPYNATFDLLGENLKEAVRDIEVASECVAIKSDYDQLSFESFEGESTASHNVSLNQDNGHQDNTPHFHGIYTLNYLKKCANVISNKQEFRLALANTHLNISFCIDFTDYHFYLAHRSQEATN